MKFKNLKPKILLTCLGIGLIYPCIAYLTAEKKFLSLINAVTINGLIFIVFGVIYSLVLHGDFDITEYVAMRWLHRNTQDYKKSYDKFKIDKNDARAGSFNYPLFAGILLLIAAAILSAIY